MKKIKFTVEGGIMKRIALITLLAVFLATNYAYAAFPIEKLYPKIEKAQTQELTQEDFEELYTDFISCIGADDIASQSIEIQRLDYCTAAIGYYTAINLLLISFLGEFAFVVTSPLLIEVLYWCAY
jgi:hypothetical protein